MGGYIPFPGPFIPQPVDIVGQWAKAVALKGMLQQQQYQQQMQPYQLQEAQSQAQIAQQQARDSQLSMQALLNSNGDPQNYLNQLSKAGVSGQFYMQAQKGFLDYQKTQAEKTQLDLKNEMDTADRVGAQLDASKQAFQSNPQLSAGLWDNALTMAEQGNLIKPGQMGHQLPQNPQAFDIAKNLLGFKSQIDKQTLEQAQAGEAAAKTPGAAAESQLKQAQQFAYQQWAAQPQNQGKTYDNYLTEQQATRAGAEAKARLPYEMSLASFNRQSAMGNVLAEHALNAVTGMFADPQHGYSQTLSQLSATKNAIASAQNGDQLAASLAPLMTALGVVSYAGIHRINQYDINAAGPQVGSVLRQIDAGLSKLGSGKLASGTATEMSGLMDNLLDAKYSTVLQSAQVAAANGGVDPSRITVMGKQGNLVRLSDAVRSAAGGGGAGGGGHIIQIGNKQYQYNGTGDTANLSNYTEVTGGQR